MVVEATYGCPAALPPLCAPLAEGPGPHHPAVNGIAYPAGEARAFSLRSSRLRQLFAAELHALTYLSFTSSTQAAANDGQGMQNCGAAGRPEAVCAYYTGWHLMHEDDDRAAVVEPTLTPSHDRHLRLPPYVAAVCRRRQFRPPSRFDRLHARSRRGPTSGELWQ